MIQGIYGFSYDTGISNTSPVNQNQPTPSDIKSAKRTGAIECETCRNRKYQDGSGEMVSFKSPTHISPGASGGAVMAHEQEHVSNAYSKAAKGGGKVIQASVSLQTAVCPECGRGYVAGGTTNTLIKYQKDSPYSQNAKSRDQEALSGNNIDFSI